MASTPRKKAAPAADAPTRKRTRAAPSAEDDDHLNEPQAEAGPVEKRPVKRARTTPYDNTASSAGYMTRARYRASALDQAPSSSVAAPAPARSTGEIHAPAKRAARKTTTTTVASAASASKSRKTTTTSTTADGVKRGRGRPRKTPLPKESDDAIVVDSVPVAAEQAALEQTEQPMDQVPDPPEVPPESPPTLLLPLPPVDTPVTAMWTPRRRRWSSGGVKLLDSVPEPAAESAAAANMTRSILSITDINAAAPPAPHTTTGLTPFVDASSWSVAKPPQVASPLSVPSTPTAQSVKREPRRPSTVAVHRFTGTHADPPTASRAALALFTPNRRPALARSVSFSASKQVLLTHSPCEYDRKSIESTRSKRSKGVISTDGYRSLMRSLDEYKLTEMQVHPASKQNTRIMMSGRRGAGMPRGAPVASPVDPEAEAMRANSFLQAILSSPEGSSAIAVVTAPSPLEDDTTPTAQDELKAPQAPAPAPASASPDAAEDDGEDDDDAETVYHPSAATTPSHSARPMRVHAVAGSSAAPPSTTPTAPTSLFSHVFSAVGSMWSRLSTPGAARGRASARPVVQFQSDLENNPFA
ncbi:hypothetical protein AMAG_00187 [Allomyces macrogynus ATCC 38327]|uniref:Uncharacterized protein n=1 Tax=Allomyces macrogynus (strain ATCC 38327) TaxID=578462 RepID=A0A0L0RUV4_ALLM3|nr:hypothetical protein AMAG_00187 [Allomyces macrogynus ATCC 38327]|eukprot:KNE54192.1 hypothetical protein AMAG_00187 [Allomyces macrogynus ATCC 38327]